MSEIQLRSHIDGLQGTLEIPGDKSISHRAVMFGAVANGKTTIKNFLPGEDCLSTISCFRKMGVAIEQDGKDVVIDGKGFDGLTEAHEVLDVGNSGTTLRLISGLLSGLPIHSILVGDESIAKRPMTRVTNPLRQMGAKIDGRENGKYTPISIRGGQLSAISYQVPVASAQVKSAVLLAGLRAEGRTIVTEIEQTRNHTETMLRMFGVQVETEGLSISIDGGQPLFGTEIVVPGDISSAAFFLAAGAIAPHSSITLRNVGLNETRTGILDVLRSMGANLEVEFYEEMSEEPRGDLTIKSSELKAVDINGSIIPRLIDELPIIALMATQAEGTTVISDAKELKVKETNRIDTVVTELRKLGADIEATEDGMIIRGKTFLHGGAVDSHGDHRIGMMLAIAATVAGGEVTLKNGEAIAVSYPEFFDHLHSLIK
ncbi:MAG: 3-phosphoshikimate 1-carboxyvinyltransferase [Bacillus sp. (in: firmicutes)]